MKIAAIDIGSNAIRLQVSNVQTHFNDEPIFKRLEYIRFPLRLGHDVFTIGYISNNKKVKFLQLMQTFRLLIDLYEIEHYEACATSAMRESKNGIEIVNEVNDKIGLTIKIIDGETEANFINLAIRKFIKDKSTLHIDVGGGSTELNLYKDSVKIASKSFKIGAVRRLEQREVPAAWDEMKTWVQKNVKNKNGITSSIGTGGNINKLFDLANQKSGKTISIHKIKNIAASLTDYSYEERQRKFQLNADRADVIIPASQIYIAVMEWAGATSITVPNVGLKDGLLINTYKNNKLQLKFES